MVARYLVWPLIKATSFDGVFLLKSVSISLVFNMLSGVKLLTPVYKLQNNWAMTVFISFHAADWQQLNCLHILYGSVVLTALAHICVKSKKESWWHTALKGTCWSGLLVRQITITLTLCVLLWKKSPWFPLPSRCLRPMLRECPAMPRCHEHGILYSSIRPVCKLHTSAVCCTSAVPETYQFLKHCHYKRSYIKWSSDHQGCLDSWIWEQAWLYHLSSFGEHVGMLLPLQNTRPF